MLASSGAGNAEGPAASRTGGPAGRSASAGRGAVASATATSAAVTGPRTRRTVAARRVLALPQAEEGTDDGDRDEHARGPAAQGEGSPVAALLLDGQLSRQRDPHHRARRGALPLRHARQALSRHAQRALHRADRVLVRRGARPGGARADAQAAVLHELDVRAPAGRGARSEARRARAAEPESRVLRLGRLRGGRGGLEAGAPVPRRQRAADAAQGHRAQDRLPRLDHGRTLDHRDHLHPHAVRAARRRRAPRRQHEPLPLQVLRARRASARSRAPTRWPRRSSRKAPRRSPW